MTDRPMVRSWPTHSDAARRGSISRRTMRTRRSTAASTLPRTTRAPHIGSSADMGLRTGRGTLDPRYFRHATPVIEGDMTALIEIRHPFKGDEEPLWDSELAEWIYPEDLAPV